MNRKPVARKRAKKRRTLSPRCSTLRCSKPAKIRDWCKKHAVLECDRRARAVARERNYCSRCGAMVALQWSHHISRARLRVRWDPRNATMHCQPCHALFTNHHDLHIEWIRDHIGAETYDALLDIAYGKRDANGVRQSPGSVHDYEIAEWLDALPPASEVA